MIEWLKAKSPADVGKFYDIKYKAAGFDALSRGEWWDIVAKLEERGGGFSKSKTLLEAGCGHGQFLEEVCESLECTGIDVSAEAVRLARERLGEDAEVINMAMEDLGGLHGKFDYIVSFGAIEHTMNPRAVFDALFGLLKPGGIILVTVPLQFDDCLRYIRDEVVQETNERFGTAEEWLDKFGNREEEFFILGEGESRDIGIIARKEKT